MSEQWKLCGTAHSLLLWRIMRAANVRWRWHACDFCFNFVKTKTSLALRFVRDDDGDGMMKFHVLTAHVYTVAGVGARCVSAFPPPPSSSSFFSRFLISARALCLKVCYI